jgi:hypothetical protein
MIGPDERGEFFTKTRGDKQEEEQDGKHSVFLRVETEMNESGSVTQYI